MTRVWSPGVPAEWEQADGFPREACSASEEHMDIVSLSFAPGTLEYLFPQRTLV